MKKKKYGMTVVCMTIGIMMIAVSCGGKKQESTDTEVQTAVVVETQAMNATEAVKETESALPAGEMYSYLTGEPVSETIGKQRPYAIMINNIDVSLPQSGVSQAEMIYEAQVESGITRLMAVFQDVDNIEKIGSIRSARHYYIDFANDNDAIYVHYGQSKYALSRIEDDNIMTIHGLSGYESKVFYRSSDRKAPHNVYTTGKMLAEGLEVTGFKMRTEQSKLSTVKALQSIGFETIASGDSYNDLGMIQASKAGFLFRSTDKIKADYPDIPAYETYDELLDAIKKAMV